ncbi:hypothetical protein FDP22_22860 (plasmid) [Paroceanicella profunda]|uniref:Serine acetyltransferase n=1 Tax=Paroceanicella profunda TaxID=2579971 RepID=A0A5B8FJS7_9RHOB|nr:hypothetical protein [Paroceanicella profunda]QDL94718.1 hypothetical protein FDP22_22860 [Paroceanicella profunda]
MQAILRLHRLSHACHRHGLHRLSRVLDGLVRFVFGAALPGRARVGPGVFLHHSGLGLVINGAAEVGPGCEIGVHVVLGGNGRGPGAPRLGAGAVVLAGAKLLGPVEVGAGAVVAANAVVRDDVPPRTLVAGQPATIRRRDIDPARYRHQPGPDVSRAKQAGGRAVAVHGEASASGGIEPPLGAGRRARPVPPGPEGP